MGGLVRRSFKGDKEISILFLWRRREWLELLRIIKNDQPQNSRIDSIQKVFQSATSGIDFNKTLSTSSSIQWRIRSS